MKTVAQVQEMLKEAREKYAIANERLLSALKSQAWTDSEIFISQRYN